MHFSSHACYIHCLSHSDLSCCTTDFLQAGAKAWCNVIVHVLDRNDNAPRFTQSVYSGSVSEAAAIGSLVLTNTSAPLVIAARDQDSELNALLSYDIIETLPRKFFHIDSSTGELFDEGLYIL
jgi:protocadherin Fat 1/2/3